MMYVSSDTYTASHTHLPPHSSYNPPYHLHLHLTDDHMSRKGQPLHSHPGLSPCTALNHPLPSLVAPFPTLVWGGKPEPFQVCSSPHCPDEILIAGLFDFLSGRWRNSKEQAEANRKGKRSIGEVGKSEKQCSVNLSRFVFQLRSELPSPCEIRQNKSLPTQVPSDSDMQSTCLHPSYV